MTGNEPTSMVCKITNPAPRDINMIWRMLFFGSVGFFDEYACRQEVIFFQDVAPSLKDTSYSHVKCYFIGIEDRGDSNFLQYVLLNQPSRIKSVVLMEDLTGKTMSLVKIASPNPESWISVPDCILVILGSGFFEGFVGFIVRFW